ncbi:nesprin-3 isoform X2 [Stigmatopora nigra]
MSEQEQQTFIERLEVALSWMKAVKESLKENDNTQGPWDVLETRLIETEKIHQSEHSGRMKMDSALVAAEQLLESGDEQLRKHTFVKLKDLKSSWEETCTYIVHCHSRIEWVWLHWSEYLKAHQEFVLWLTRQQLDLDLGVELQLGLKEKLWKVSQQKVIVSDVHGQKALLERLLDEAAVLHNRTQDPSLESQGREKLLKTFSDIRDKVEERLSLLEEIAEDHKNYQGSVQRFQSWLLSKTKELTDLLEKKDMKENKLLALQVFDSIIRDEEKNLQHIESLAEIVRAKTSPAGAEVVANEAVKLKVGWQKLRQSICEVEEGLQSTLYTNNEHISMCKLLEQDIGCLQSRLQGLKLDLDENYNVGDDCIKEQMGRWSRYMDVRKALMAEGTQVDHLNLQLKEILRFSEDSQHISNLVIDLVKEYQSVKCKAAKLCAHSESCLRNMLQEQLVVFAQWQHRVSQVLETSVEVTDSSDIITLVQNTERLLKDSIELQDCLNYLNIMGDWLDSLFGPERSDGLRNEISTAISDRKLLHVELIQRKGTLQEIISRKKNFGYANILTDGMIPIEGPQPDILAKKSQSDQFKMSTGQYESKKRKFEKWLCRENKLLSAILSNRGSTLKTKNLKIQQDTLSVLQSRVTWGQEQFQLLLQENGINESGSAQEKNTSLEELRYRWMLYKSKLNTACDLGTSFSLKKPGLLQRVCRLALPLWILFLALWILAFILPLMYESNSCSIYNNFARSFSIMLLYTGPPPT